MKISIIGTGLQFSRRAPVILNSKDDELISICGIDKEKTIKYSKAFNCEIDRDWRVTVDRKDIDVIVITTPPHLHKEITLAALSAGKHVLCEKPLSKTNSEALEMYHKCVETRKILKCGFNHRYHPAMLKAKGIIDSGKIGNLTFGRAIYGICGRPEYKNEWRADPNKASGGQFIEQGSHLIDLFRWYFGEVDCVASMIGIDYFKDQALDDGGFSLFKFKNGATASMHTSLAQWINTFSLEIYGTEGYLRIEGLGGGYGDHKLIEGKRDFNAPFSENITFFRGGDKSWLNEWSEFKQTIKDNESYNASAYDGLQAMKIANACYESSKKNEFIFIV
jgi:predicted dehydrogenase